MSENGTQMDALYNRLAQQLRGSKTPFDWWLSRVGAINMLRQGSPRHYSALRAHFHHMTGLEADDHPWKKTL